MDSTQSHQSSSSFHQFPQMNGTFSDFQIITPMIEVKYMKREGNQVPPLLLPQNDLRITNKFQMNLKPEYTIADQEPSKIQPLKIQQFRPYQDTALQDDQQDNYGQIKKVSSQTYNRKMLLKNDTIRAKLKQFKNQSTQPNDNVYTSAMITGQRQVQERSRNFLNSKLGSSGSSRKFLKRKQSCHDSSVITRSNSGVFIGGKIEEYRANSNIVKLKFESPVTTIKALNQLFKNSYNNDRNISQNQRTVDFDQIQKQYHKSYNKGNLIYQLGRNDYEDLQYKQLSTLNRALHNKNLSADVQSQHSKKSYWQFVSSNEMNELNLKKFGVKKPNGDNYSSMTRNRKLDVDQQSTITSNLERVQQNQSTISNPSPSQTFRDQKHHLRMNLSEDQRQKSKTPIRLTGTQNSNNNQSYFSHMRSPSKLRSILELTSSHEAKQDNVTANVDNISKDPKMISKEGNILSILSENQQQPNQNPGDNLLFKNFIRNIFNKNNSITPVLKLQRQAIRPMTILK